MICWAKSALRLRSVSIHSHLFIRSSIYEWKQCPSLGLPHYMHLHRMTSIWEYCIVIISFIIIVLHQQWHRLTATGRHLSFEYKKLSINVIRSVLHDENPCSFIEAITDWRGRYKLQGYELCNEIKCIEISCEFHCSGFLPVLRGTNWLGMLCYVCA